MINKLRFWAMKFSNKAEDKSQTKHKTQGTSNFA